jgi:hypothetical protein
MDGKCGSPGAANFSWLTLLSCPTKRTQIQRPSIVDIRYRQVLDLLVGDFLLSSASKNSADADAFAAPLNTISCALSSLINRRVAELPTASSRRSALRRFRSSVDLRGKQ